MNFASVLFLPLAFMAPASSALQPMAGVERSGGQADRAALARLWPAPGDEAWDGVGEADGEGRAPYLQAVSFEPDDAWQVRIERRVTIRISPHEPARMPPEMDADLPDGDPRSAGRYEERPVGNCVPADAIAGVQPERGNRLLLFMRDHRVVVAELERTCRAMDFYSGFYLAHSRDGKVCVRRDTLQSRSGMKCGLARMYQLVPTRD